MPGKRIDGDVDRLAHGDVDDVGLVDLDLGGDDGHVGEGHQGGAFGVLDADDDGFAFAHRHVGHEAVEGSAADGLVSASIVGCVSVATAWFTVAARGGGLGLGLDQRGLALREGGDVMS